MEISMPPGCAGDVQDLLEMYEARLAESGLRESTFCRNLGCNPDIRSRLKSGRVMIRTLGPLRKKLLKVRARSQQCPNPTS